MSTEEKKTETAEVVESEKVERFSKEWWLRLVKDTWADKVKCLYILTLALQVLFILLQFIPMMTVSTEIKESFLSGYKITTEDLSIFGFCRKEGFLFVWYLLHLALFAISVKCTVGYFVRKRDKMKSGFLLAKIITILMLLLFVVIVVVAQETVADYTEYGAVCELKFAGHLYWLTAVALIVALFVISVKVKEVKEEEKVAARVQEELRKKEEQAVEEK